jgi:hypothetical protein
VRRTLFIGDVHGCNDELGDLLKLAGWTTEDRLVLVGDLPAWCSACSNSARWQ